MGRRSTRRHRAPWGAELVRARQVSAAFEPRRWFSHDEALAALVFLRPVVEEMHGAFQAAMECHRLLRCAVFAEHIAQLGAQQDRAIARFDRALDDVELTGAQLLDVRSFALGFPTLQQGRVHRLVWSPKEIGALRLEALKERESRVNRC
ncbi:MAG: DUF2203 family protein [Phycisphaerales bacterium]|nr:DUF2203 family protein [Phycisphaerales bacterium]